jgi:hypothetical protein
MNYVELLQYLASVGQHILKEGTHYLLTEKQTYVRSMEDYRFYPRNDTDKTMVDATKPSDIKKMVAANDEKVGTK